MRDKKNTNMKAEKEVLEQNPELVEKVKQKPSASYTVRAFGQNAKKLKELDIITEEQFQHLQELHTKIIQQWMQTISL